MPWTYTFHRQAMLNRTTRILKPIASRTRFHGETIKMLWLKRSCYDLKRSQRFHAKTRPLQWLKTKCYDLTLPLVYTMIFMIMMMMMRRRRRTTYHILCFGAPSPPLAQPQLSSHPALFSPPLAPSENMAFRPESVEVSVGKPASDEGLVKNYMVLPSHASQTFIFFWGEMVKSGRCNIHHFHPWVFPWFSPCFPRVFPWVFPCFPWRNPGRTGCSWCPTCCPPRVGPWLWRDPRPTSRTVTRPKEMRKGGDTMYPLVI